MPARKPTTSLDDRIFDLPILADRPREDTVVVLHEATERSRLGNVGDGGLYVAGAVHGAAGNLGWAARPVPRITEARETFVEHGFLEARLAPGLAPVDRYVNGLDGPVARPSKA